MPAHRGRRLRPRADRALHPMRKTPDIRQVDRGHRPVAAYRRQPAIADGKETKAKIGEPPVLDDGLRREADDRVVAMSTSEKLMKEVRRIFRTYRQLNGDQQLLRLKRSFVDPGEKLARCNPPSPLGPRAMMVAAKAYTCRPALRKPGLRALGFPRWCRGCGSQDGRHRRRHRSAREHGLRFPGISGDRHDVSAHRW